MDKTFQPSKFESDLYAFWEKNKLFHGRPGKGKKSFSIILPPPNANADLHIGHAMYVYEDVMIRHHRIKGYEVLWLPGADHAGIETQFVFEKHLKKEGKSRFDYSRPVLFQMIWDFVKENRGTMEGQLRALGFALDWTREKYTMDPDIVSIVYDTFEKLYHKKLLYRAERLVNYCTHCGTSFSDLEVVDKQVELEKGLFIINFPLEKKGFIPIATTRPETMLGDVAVMVNPTDKRYKDLIGQTVILPITKRKIPIIADSYVDKKFGTGAVKVTPAHDFNDFEIAKKHKLSYPPVIGFDGKIQNTKTAYDSMYVSKARTAIVEELLNEGLLLESRKHTLVLKTCYKCGRTLETLPKEQWFIQVKPFVDDAKKLIASKKIQVYPKRFTKQLTRILDEFIDWNISRQIVWGIQIPAYFCKSTKKWFISKTPPADCAHCDKKDFVQDEDTFDTWFSSSQWPFATLQSLGKKEYEFFYPTSVMETGYDILRAWVSRMIMMGTFATGKEPFRTIFLHGMVRDKHGAKMSKSKGNVVNPMDMVHKYGADAFRASLVFSAREGNDMAFSEEKVVGMRNFANKVWNIGRFIEMNRKSKGKKAKSKEKNIVVEELQKEFAEVKKMYEKHMDAYEFSKALNLIHEFLWHRFADYYLEQLKEELKNGKMDVSNALETVYVDCLVMLHPFMPFITEAVYKVFYGEDRSVITHISN